MTATCPMPRIFRSRRARIVCPLLGLALAGLLVPLAACAGGGSSAGMGTVIQIDDDAYATLGYRRDWKGFPFVSPKGRLTDIIVGTDLVVTLESGSTVTVLNTDTGAQRWSSRLAGPLTKFISLRVGRYDGRDVVLASSESALYLLDIDTGNLLGRQTYEKVVNTGPLLVNNLAIYGSSSGEVLAHLLTSGGKLWGHDLDGTLEVGPTYVAGALAAVSSTGRVIFLDPTSGDVWGAGSMFLGTETEPVAGDKALFVASLDQSLYAFDPLSGRQLWRHRTPAPLRFQPTAHDGRLYCEMPNEGLTAFDQDTGAILWTNKQVHGTVIGVRNERLIVWDGTTASTVGPHSGTLYDQVTLKGVARLVMDRFVDGNLYAMGTHGGVARLVPRF